MGANISRRTIPTFGRVFLPLEGCDFDARRERYPIKKSRLQQQRPPGVSLCLHSVCPMAVWLTVGDVELRRNFVAMLTCSLCIHNFFSLSKRISDNQLMLPATTAMPLQAQLAPLLTLALLTVCQVNACSEKELLAKTPTLRMPRTLTSTDIPHPAPSLNAVGINDTKLSLRARAKNIADPKFARACAAKCPPMLFLLVSNQKQVQSRSESGCEGIFAAILREGPVMYVGISQRLLPRPMFTTLRKPRFVSTSEPFYFAPQMVHVKSFDAYLIDRCGKQWRSLHCKKDRKKLTGLCSHRTLFPGQSTAPKVPR